MLGFQRSNGHCLETITYPVTHFTIAEYRLVGTSRSIYSDVYTG